MDDRASKGMDLGRREFVVGAAVAAAAAATLAPRAAAAAEAPKEGSTEQLAALAATCVQRGEECISHCFEMFSAGDTTLASCARSVHEMTPVCEALGRLALMDSAHLRSFSPVCAEICEACEKECRKHAKDHEVCARCGDACKDLAAALRKRSA
jgi:Cys-rich four helix bundle protein (predicted Tat secretion target)